MLPLASPEIVEADDNQGPLDRLIESLAGSQSEDTYLFLGLVERPIYTSYSSARGPTSGVGGACQALAWVGVMVSQSPKVCSCCSLSLVADRGAVQIMNMMKSSVSACYSCLRILRIQALCNIQPETSASRSDHVGNIHGRADNSSTGERSSPIEKTTSRPDLLFLSRNFVPSAHHHTGASASSAR